MSLAQLVLLIAGMIFGILCLAGVTSRINLAGAGLVCISGALLLGHFT